MPASELKLDGDADWQTQWDAFYAFVRQWLGVEFTVDTPGDEVLYFERSTGIALPPSAHEWFRFASASVELAPHFTFRDCLVVEQLKDHDAVSLLLQGEGDTYWAIETPHLTEENPPVTVYFLDYDDPEGHFVREGTWSPTITSFAFDYFLAYLHSSGGGFSVGTSCSNFSRDALVGDFGPPVEFGHLEIFYTDGIFAAVSTSPANWHFEELKVEIQRPTALHDLPVSIQRLIPEAHVLSGVIGNYR